MPPLVNGESASFAALNRNKRSLVLDLKQPEAREVVFELVKKSDVFLENNRPGALEGIGLGPEQVRAINPDIVYTSASGFGQTGPYRRRAGVNLTYVPYTGGAPAINALLGGHITAVLQNYSEIGEQLRAGKLRALATPAAKRIEPLPDLPTVAESGYQDFAAEVA